MTIIRYHVSYGNEYIDQSEDGEYVSYEDYAALEQQLAESHRALRAETTAHENTQMQLEKMIEKFGDIEEEEARESILSEEDRHAFVKAFTKGSSQ